MGFGNTDWLCLPSSGSNAVQIIPPHDAGIAASIDDNLQVPDEAWQPEELLASSELCIDQTETLTQAYMETLAGLRSSALPASQDSFAFVYTPIHGVGFPFARSVLSTFGFPESTMHAVPSQVEPDPDFPTVKFPNPEEKGALDAACAHADEKGLKLVLANDPDADRFSAAEKDGCVWLLCLRAAHATAA
jgi:phosphoglucomutase